jgi:hypothetical protein
MLFGNQPWVLFEGVGAMVGQSAAYAHRFYDGLAWAAASDKLIVRDIALMDYRVLCYF